MNISQLVSKTVAMGIPPLELRYVAVRDCSTQNPIAYRADVVVNSVEYGELTKIDFGSVCESNDVGIRLAEWAIKNVLREIKTFPHHNRPMWVSVPCPVSMALLPNMYNKVRKLLELEGDGLGHTQLCLEFPDNLLDREETRIAILDLKLLNVRSMVVCSNENTCSFFRLTGIPVDDMLLSKDMSSLVDDRNKPGVLASLIRYLESMNVGVIANEPQNNEEIRMFSRLDCVGYIAQEDQSLPKDELFESIDDSDDEDDEDIEE